MQPPGSPPLEELSGWLGGVGKPSHCHRQGRLLFYSVANLICFGLVALLPCATISSLNIWQQNTYCKIMAAWCVSLIPCAQQSPL